MRRVFKKSVASAMFVTTGLFATGWGCGGGSGDQKSENADMSQLAPAPDLSVFVQVVAGSNEAEPFVPNVKTALTTAMTGAGYKLVATEDGKPDVVAKVTVNATQEQSLFQVQVNGKTQVSYKVQLSASFVSAAEQSVLDSATSEFSGKDGEIEQKAIDKLLVHLGTTGKLNAYALNLKTKAREAEAKVAQEEEDLWKAANADGCKKPATKTSCDGVKAYIAKYPSGKYTSDARAAMQEGETARLKLEEDDMWKAAMVDQCKKPTKSYDCKGVEDYIKKYPTGAYAADAKAAMKASEAQRDALKRKEDASKKAANRDGCIKDCRRAYETYAAFEILVARCVQTECS